MVHTRGSRLISISLLLLLLLEKTWSYCILLRWLMLPHASLLADMCFCMFSRAHLQVVGMLRFLSDINQPSLPTPFLFCSCVCFCLYGPFDCISFHKFSRKLSVFWPCSSAFISALLVFGTISLFMKVSFNPDIIPSGWLGSKHQLTN